MPDKMSKIYKQSSIFRYMLKNKKSPLSIKTVSRRKGQDHYNHNSVHNGNWFNRRLSGGVRTEFGSVAYSDFINRTQRIKMEKKC